MVGVVDDIALCAIFMMVGSGLTLLVWKIVPFVLRAWFPNRYKQESAVEWQDEALRAFVTMMEDKLQSARSKAYFASLVGQVPEDFNPVIWEGFSIAHRFEEQVLAQLKSEGIVAPEMIEKIYAPRPPRAYAREDVPEELPEPSNIRRLPSGRFLPRRASGG